MRTPRTIHLLAVTALLACSGDLPTAPSPVVRTITLSPSSPASLHIGEQLSIGITVAYVDNVPETTPYPIVDNSNPGVVFIRKFSRTQFTLEAMQPGTTTLTAHLYSGAASVVITVREPGPVTSIVIAGGQLPALSPGVSYPLAMYAADSDGVMVKHPVTYATSDSNIATITAAGVVQPRDEGSVTISATMDGITGKATAVVLAPAHAVLWTQAGTRDLGVMPGYTASNATAISATGAVAGNLVRYFDDNGTRAFSWTAAAGMTLLPLPPTALSSRATGINSAGEVVGYVVLPGGLSRGVIWSAGGGLQLLTGSGNLVETQASAINDRGDIVGWARGVDGQQRAFLSSAAQRQELFIVKNGVALAVNADGVVVGNQYGQPFAYAAATQKVEIELLPGDVGGVVTSISNAGDMLGTSFGGCDYYEYVWDECAPLQLRAVMWTSTGVPTDLSTKPGIGGRTLAVAGINSSRQIVGSIDTKPRAFIWSQSSGVVDLGVLPGRTTSAATAINDAGQVVGWSANP